MTDFKQWEGFEGRIWKEEVNTRDFIQKNYTPYEGDESFLAGPTERTKELWGEVLDLLLKEREQGGVLDMDTKTVTGIVSHPAGYIDNAHREKETIVGLQTDKPLKRALHVNGGIRIACQAASQHGYKVDENVVERYTFERKTHNAGVFDVYTPEMRACRSAHIITGLPDGYGRGRIIGDYRRVALYGVDYLIKDKEAQKASTPTVMTADNIRDREELQEQIRALGELKMMAETYGFDISNPATNTQEAIQWMYFAYLAAVKEQNGAAMSIGRTSTFIDIYAERDLANGTFTEEQIQEFVDHFIMKLRMVKFARTPEYQALFTGDPQWVTESIGGMGVDGRTLVTKMSYRYLHTLENMGTSPEPNMTVLWSTRLPENFKKFCAKTSVASSSIQYENDDLMRVYHGDDYGIACCVSSMRIGKEMQFFGARANLAKCLLYAINGGVDERTGETVVPGIRPILDEVLSYEAVRANYEQVLSYAAELYADTVNIIHYMHDKYAYEASQMALHDTQVERLTAFGIAGLSVAADSLSAIRYASVRPVRNEAGVAVEFETEGDFPKYGNDDDRADDEAVFVVRTFIRELKKHPLYRGAKHTLSALTITSNVMYGKKTGSTPDGRKAGEPFAPGANPMHGRDESGSLASLNSVAKIPYRAVCQDGVSNTFSIVPNALGKTAEERRSNLVQILDGYFVQGAHHLNVNVMNREVLLDAMEHPEKYPTLTIRVSGYAVNFNRLSREQQLEVVKRTFHESM